MIDINELREILPHAYPFLLIDKVIEFEQDKRLVAIKNITSNEWVALGNVNSSAHFPETLVIEAASQAALVLYHRSKVKPGERPKYFLGKATANFFKEVTIGDQLRIEAFANKMLEAGGYSDVNVSVDSKKVAEVEIIYSVKR